MKPRVVSVLALALVASLIAPRAGQAWNPNTHSYAAELARQDALDGFVTINGRNYPVRSDIVAAIRDWPDFYNAGVVGPDGMPDITYGQVVIHPEKTGEWLRHILNSGWAAQSDPSYSATEKSQILAFTYGYLTHGAGDMWAHTLVNDVSDPNHTIGVFPAISEALTDLNKAAIAIRHLIAERYIADGTPGVDGNPERGPAPGGDVSDDSSPGQPFNAPHRWVYETLINPATVTPIPAVRDHYKEARGPIIGFFLELRDDLQDFVDYDPDPLGDVINAYNDTIEDLMDLTCSCNFGSDVPGCSNHCCLGICNDVCDAVVDAVDCPVSLLALGFDFVVDSFEAFLAVVADITEEVALLVLDAYVAAWIDDINDGLVHWDELGLAFSKGFFDPQVRRDIQNDECHLKGDESSLLRSQCENGIGVTTAIFDEIDPFINDHLLSMIGLPDFVGDLRGIVGDITDFVQEILDYIQLPFNPIFEAIAQIKEFITDLILDLIQDAFGIDLEAIADFVKAPNRFVCLDQTPFTLPVLGDVTLPLFADNTTDRLDALMHLSGGHVQETGLPLDCGRFTDDAQFDTELFPPFKNTVTMSKLLLLDGAEMNHMLSDNLGGRTISTYSGVEDVMTLALDGTTWLRLIDGDHAWRQDGAPLFPARPEHITAGTGQFPIWESCVQRPAMRSLFVDWENGTDNFPDLGDPVSGDPVNDPNAPTSSLARAGAFYDDGVHKFVAADNVFTHTAHDGPAGRAFPDAELELQHRFYPTPGPASSFVTTGQPAAFSLTGPDGIYVIDIRSGDRCHTCAEGDALAPEATQSSQFVLDASPPVTTCSQPPFGLVFDTDDLSSVQFTISDGPLGSGVASQSSTLNGYITAAGTIPAPVGFVLDMYLLYPGVRTVAVQAADHLGNSGSTSCTFTIQPTITSMLNNLDRALSEHLLKNYGTYRSLQAKLQAADAAARRGQCNTAGNQLGALVNLLEAQRGKGIEAVFADRFRAFALDLISRGGCGTVAAGEVGEIR